jgi:hypothetical protein
MALTGYNSLVTSLLAPNPVLKASFTGQAAGQLHSSLYLAGLPGAAAAPAPGINGAALTAYAGQLSFPATSGGTTIYLAGMQLAEAGNIGGVIVCDRLWHNSGLVVTTTGAQAITFPGLPARDQNGASAGAGVQLALEVVTTIGNAAPVTNCTASYTDSSSASGNTAAIASIPTGAVAGTFLPFTLAAGDMGVQSVASVTLGTSLVSGSVSLVCYRVVAMVPTTTANVISQSDWTQLGLPVMYNTSVPWMVYMLSGTAGGQVVGSMVYAQA